MDHNQDLEKGGVKRDIGKPRMDLLPPNAIMALADLFRMGADKYDDRNWEKGMDQGRAIAAAGRHLFAYMGGEDIDPDPEAGTHHLIHLAWNALVAYEMEVCGLTKDARTAMRLTCQEAVARDGVYHERGIVSQEVWDGLVDGTADRQNIRHIGVKTSEAGQFLKAVRGLPRIEITILSSYGGLASGPSMGHIYNGNAYIDGEGGIYVIPEGRFQI